MALQGSVQSSNCQPPGVSLPFLPMKDTYSNPTRRPLRWHLRRHLRRPFRGLLFLASLLSACSDSTGPIFTFWEGTLEPIRPSLVGGRVVAVTQHGRTDVGINMEDGDPGTTYAWRVDSGTCQEEGIIQGGAAQYPLLLPGHGGSDSAEATLSALFKSGKQFAGRISRVNEDGSEQVVACGELEETES
mgnify:CR=1 FL=1